MKDFDAPAAPSLPPPLASSPTPPPRIARWPVPIGLVCIVFGAGGLLQSLTSPLGAFIAEQQMKSLAGKVAPEEVDAYLEDFRAILLPSSISTGLVALLLLTGGILLVRRRPLASPLLQTWSVLRILVGGYFVFRTTALTRSQMALTMDPAVLGTGGNEVAKIAERITQVAVWVGLGVGFLWLAALPVFLLCWFNRQKVRDTVAGW